MTSVVIPAKLLLDSVSGSLGPGTLTALVGSSGSGKTLLLNFLTARMKYSKNLEVEGSVWVNGSSSLGLSTIRRKMVYL